MMKCMLMAAALLTAVVATYPAAAQLSADNVVTSGCGSAGTSPPTNPYSHSTQDSTGRTCVTVATPSGSPIAVTPQPTNSSGALSGATVGTSSSSVLAANTAKVYLAFINVSQNATICLNAGSAATISGTACAAGEIALAPGGGGYVWESDYVPSDQWFAISSAASTPLTVIAK
jgi:hypothetical protein